MVFCYQNCFDLLSEKNVLVIEKTFFSFLSVDENQIEGTRLKCKSCARVKIVVKKRLNSKKS